MLDNEIEALDHLTDVLNGGDTFFHSFKLTTYDIARIFNASYLSKVDGFRLLGVLCQLTKLVNHDNKLNKLLSSLEDQELFLFDNLSLEPSLILGSYIKNVIQVIRSYPDIFRVLCVPGRTDEVEQELGELLDISPHRKSTTFTKKLSLKLRRTSTKSLLSVQSSVLSNDTLQTSINTTPTNSKFTIEEPCCRPDYHTDPATSTQISLNVEAVFKNIIYQFSKMFQNIDIFHHKFGDGHIIKEDLKFLKQCVNESVVVETYNMLTEYSLRLLDEEMSDINNMIIKV